MQTRLTRKIAVGWAVALAAAAFSTKGWTEPSATTTTSGEESALNGLGDQLSRTGRFAVVPVTTVSAIAPSERTRGAPGDVRVRKAAGDSSNSDPREASAPESLADFQYRKAFGAVEDCRFDIARRRSVVPQKVPARAMTLRWTIEETGAVRDAEAISVWGTDPELAACAKRVFTGWRFLPPPDGQVVVERTFTFRTLP